VNKSINHYGFEINGSCPFMISKNHHTVSVIICTHNHVADLVATLLECINIVNKCVFKIQILVCANGCTDGTENEVEAIVKESPAIDIKLIVRTQAGKTASLIDGILNSSGEFALILDDDNTLLDGWIEAAINIFKQEPGTGVLGCNSILPKDYKVNGFVNEYMNHFAVGEQSANVCAGGSNVKRVWGAGMILRLSPIKQWLKSGQGFLLGGRVRNNLLAGEDTELCLLFYRWRYATRAIDFIGIIHRIDPKRLNEVVLRRLWRSEGTAYQIYRNYDKSCAFIEGSPISKIKVRKIMASFGKSILVVALSTLILYFNKKTEWLKRREIHVGLIKGIYLFIKRRTVIQKHFTKLEQWESLR